MGSAGMSAEKVGGTMSTIRWWYESLQGQETFQIKKENIFKGVTMEKPE